MIILSGTWRFSPERSYDEARAYLTWLTASARAEPGCIAHSISLDLFEQNQVHHYATFADDAALAEHAARPWGGPEWRNFGASFGIEDFALERFEGNPVGAADPSAVHGTEAHADHDDRLILLGGSWYIGDALTAADTAEYNRYIIAGVSHHEPGALLYLNGADLIDPHRINSVCLFADEAALLAHRKSPWVTPEWWRFGATVGLRDFNVTHFRARYRGKVDRHDLSRVQPTQHFTRRVPAWCKPSPRH